MAAGFEVDWSVADAERLAFHDGAFDVVISTVGLDFAPRPDVAIEEAFRVARPGGIARIVARKPGRGT